MTLIHHMTEAQLRRLDELFGTPSERGYQIPDWLNDLWAHARLDWR